ncbi:hypothetical protein ACQ4WZ_10140 [Janthinobacterium sp. HLS12-2]
MMLLYKSRSAARACAPYLMAIKEFHFFTILPSVAHARTRYPRGVAFHHNPSPPAGPSSCDFKKTQNKSNKSQISLINQIFPVK